MAADAYHALSHVCRIRGMVQNTGDSPTGRLFLHCCDRKVATVSVIYKFAVQYGTKLLDSNQNFYAVGSSRENSQTIDGGGHAERMGTV